jgi:hypothetical protein
MALNVQVRDADIERWIEHYLRRRRPELEGRFRAAWDAFRRARRTGRLRDDDLALIAEAARGSEAVLWQNATSWLATLAMKHATAQAEVDAMSRDALARVRIAALGCLGRSSPRPLVTSVVLPALTDKSSRVRRMAADTAGRLGLREALPAMQRQRRVEKDAKARATLAFEIPLLRDGYIAKKTAGGIDLTVCGRGGVRGGHVSADEVRRQGLDKIVAEWKRDLEENAITIEELP